MDYSSADCGADSSSHFYFTAQTHRDRRMTSQRQLITTEEDTASENTSTALPMSLPD